MYIRSEACIHWIRFNVRNRNVHLQTFMAHPIYDSQHHRQKQLMVLGHVFKNKSKELPNEAQRLQQIFKSNLGLNCKY